MGLTDIQELVERSIYEQIRLVLVREGYIPDITQVANRAEFDLDLSEIENAKGFAVELFNNGSSQSKGTKKVPRIAMVGRRVLVGEIGNAPEKIYEKDPLNPNSIISVTPAPETDHLQLDIHLVSNTAKQERFLNAVIAAALKTRSYIPFVNDPTGKSKFFLRQFNYYDLPDAIEGIAEMVYSYEVTDLYLFQGNIESTNVPLIQEITMETTLIQLGTILARNGTIIGPYRTDDALVIDLSGIHL